MPGALRIALVDIDGTLLDSNYHHTIAWSRAFAEVGHAVPLWRIHRHMGMGGDRLVAAVAGDDVERVHGDTIRDVWERGFDEMISETRLLDGATELLDGLAAAGLEVVLASSGKPHHARHALELVDAEHRADAWTTSEDADETKPHPELLDRALEKVGGSPESAVMVGDAIWDVDAARQRGIPSLCTLTGGFGRAELLDAGAAAVYDDPRDLLAHLDDALRSAASV